MKREVLDRESDLFVTPNRNAYTREVKTEPAARRAGAPPPPPVVISRGVQEAMGKHQWQVTKLREDEEVFFKINKCEFENEDLLSVRKEIWDWMVICVGGENKNLFCAHILRETDKWDIFHLFRSVKDFLQTENYREYGTRLERFFTSQPKTGEDIFSYISRVDKYKEEVEKLEHLAQDAGETLVVPKFFQVWKILSAVEKFPEYRMFVEKVQQMTPQEWVRLRPESIRGELHKIHSNRVSLQVLREEKKESNTNNNNNNVALQDRSSSSSPSSPSPVSGKGG